MGVANPLDAAYDAIADIEAQLSDLSLDDLFPDITNPLIPMGLGLPFTTPGGDTGALNLPGVNPNAVTNQGGNINYNQLTTQQKIDRLFRPRLKNHDTQDDKRTYYKFAWPRDWVEEGYCKHQNQSFKAYE